MNMHSPRAWLMKIRAHCKRIFICVDLTNTRSLLHYSLYARSKHTQTHTHIQTYTHIPIGTHTVPVLMRIGYVRRVFVEFSSLLKPNYKYLLVSTSNSATLVSSTLSSCFNCARTLFIAPLVVLTPPFKYLKFCFFPPSSSQTKERKNQKNKKSFCTKPPTKHREKSPTNQVEKRNWKQNLPCTQKYFC